MNSNNRQKIKRSFGAGAKKGWSGFIWMLKIILPISFLTMLADHSGLIHKADFLLSPAMDILSLPPVAAVPLIAGLLTGIYGAVAAMAVLPLTTDQMTLIAVFLLISHNLIQEGIVQAKSGIHPAKATLFRLCASFVTVIILAQFLDSDTATAATGQLAGGHPPLSEALAKWAGQSALLFLKIFAIIMTVMIVMEIMKNFGAIPYVVRVLRPVLKLLGLENRLGVLWLTAATFGIAYGGAVIVSEVKENNIPKNDLTRLHLSIGINHAMIEDPSLFLPLGLNPFFLWVPRLITAIVAVWLLNLAFAIRLFDRFEWLPRAFGKLFRQGQG